MDFLTIKEFYKFEKPVFRLAFSKKTRLKTTISLFSSFCSVLIKLFLPVMTISFIIPCISEPTKKVVIIWMSFGIAYFIGQVEPIMRRLFLNLESAELSQEMTNRILAHYLTLPLDNRLSSPVGEIVHHFNTAYNAVAKILPSLFAEIIPNSFEIIVSTGILIYLTGNNGVILLVIFIVYIVFAIKNSRKKEETQKAYVESVFASYGNLTPILNNYEAIHYFNNVSYELNQHSVLSEKITKTMKKDIITTSLSTLKQSLIITVGLIILCLLILAHTKTKQANTILIFFYLFQTITPLNSLLPSINNLHDGIVGLKRILIFLNKKSEIIDTSKNKPLIVSEKESDIHFIDVTFKYKHKNTSITILDKVNFYIPAGKKTALLGLSGAGKSTILRLLFRFYEVDKGEIKINNQNIKHVSLESLRSSIAVVPQNPVLFNKSLRENILYANFDSSKKQLTSAITRSELFDYINRLPNGIETKVGEDGQKISGGERQRVAIARALLKNSPIFIFDEATSSLDTETEKALLNNLEEISKDKTTLIITHRLNTITKADQVIILNEGKILEQGKYKELIANKTSKLFKLAQKYRQSAQHGSL